MPASPFRRGKGASLACVVVNVWCIGRGAEDAHSQDLGRTRFVSLNHPPTRCAANTMRPHSYGAAIYAGDTNDGLTDMAVDTAGSVSYVAGAFLFWHDMAW